MDIRPLNCLESDDLCKFEIFGLTNSAMMPVMITMAPTSIGIQQQQIQQFQQNPNTITSFRQHHHNQHQQPLSLVNPLLSSSSTGLTSKAVVGTQTVLISPTHIPLKAKMLSQDNQRYEQTSSGNIIEDTYKKFPISRTLHSTMVEVGDVNTSSSVGDDGSNNGIYGDSNGDGGEYNIGDSHEDFLRSGSCELHPHHNNQTKIFSRKIMEPRNMVPKLHEAAKMTTVQEQQQDISSSCISKLALDSKNDECVAGCNALMMMKIVGSGSNTGDGGASNNSGGSNGNSYNRNVYANHIKICGDTITKQRMYEGIDDGNVKHCNCMYMSFDSFTPDFQTTGFGCLPDVTEHSNVRRTTLRQDSTSNSEFADITSIDKTKKIKNSKTENKRKYCIFSLSIILSLLLFAIISIIVYQFISLKPNRNSYDQRIKIVKKILKEVPLIDGHNNLPWNIRKYAHNSLELIDLGNYDYGHQKTIWHKPLWSQTDIPRMKEGLLGAQIWSAYVPCEAQGLDAVQLALEQIDIIHRFTELYPNDLVLVVSSQEILSAHKKGTLASLIGIEGGHALGSSLGVLRSLHALGARYLTLTHQCDTSWAGSSSMSMDKGLTAFGKAVVKEMNRLGMMIDLSHSSDATARDVLEVTRAPVIFSHSVARSLCNSTRNIPDDVLRAVADNGGLIMISFDSQYVSCDESSTIEDVISHIKYIRSIVGIQHIGIGAGFDGITNPPKDLENVSKYPNLFASLLKDTNWSEEDVAMLAGKNFIRVLKSVENVRDYWKRAAIPPVEMAEPIKKSHCTYMSS